MSSAWEQRLNDPGYVNWLKLGQCLLYMCEGIADFVQSITDKYHATLQNRLGTQPCSTGSCLLRKQHVPPDGNCPICGPWKRAILKEHARAHQRNWKIAWGNCNPLKWPINPWEVAKVYMPYIGNHANQSVNTKTTDSSGLLNLIINCKEFHSHISNIKNAEMARSVRNKVMHSSKMSLSNAELQSGINNILQLLMDGQELIHRQESQNAAKMIKQIQSGNIEISNKDLKETEKKFLHEVFHSLEERIYELEDRIPNDLQDMVVEFRRFLDSNSDLHYIFQVEASNLRLLLRDHSFAMEDRISKVEDKLSDLKVHLEEKCSGLQVSPDIGADDESVKKTCGDLLRSMYQESLSIIQPISWCDEEFDFDSIYTDLYLTTETKTKSTRSDINDKETSREEELEEGRFRSNETGSAEKDKRTVISMNDVLQTPSTVDTKPTRILIEGVPGSGKTTLCCKLARDWAQNKLPAFQKFDMLLFLRVREMEVSLKDSLFEILLPEDDTILNKENVWKYIQENQEKVCFLLDGVDEANPKVQTEILKLLNRKILRNCFVVVTSRMDESPKPNLFHKVVTCHGFEEKTMANYIRKYFSLIGNPLSGDKLIRKLSEQHDPFSLGESTSPMNVLIYCLIWEEHNETLPDITQLTRLYSEFLICLVRRFCSKETELGVEMYGDEIPDQCKEVVLALGKLALDMTLADMQTIDAREVEKLPGYTRIVAKLGILHKVYNTSKIRRKSFYMFLHLSFQDYLAAYYMSHLSVQNPTLFADIQGKVQLSFGFGLFQVFCCGFLGKEAGKLFNKFEYTDLQLTYTLGNGCTNPLPIPDPNIGPIHLMLNMILEVNSKEIVDKCAACLPNYITLPIHFSKRALFGLIKLLHSEYCSLSAIDIAIPFCTPPVSKVLYDLCDVKTVRYLSIHNFDEVMLLKHDPKFCNALSTLIKENTSIEFLAVDKIDEEHYLLGPRDFPPSTKEYYDILVALSEGIRGNTGIKSLRIGRGPLDEKGMKILLEGLEHNEVLKQLSLVGNHKIYYNGWKYLYTYLVKPYRKLEILELRDVGLHNFQFSPQQKCNGFLALCHALAEDCNLTYLDMTDCNFKHLKAKYLAIALRKNSKLRTLDLSHTSIDADTVIQIFEALNKNSKTNLQSLNLSCCASLPSKEALAIRGIHWFGEKIFYPGKSKFTARSNFRYLNKNQASVLSKFLQCNKCLTSLDLSYVKTKSCYLLRAMKETNLHALNLCGFKSGNPERFARSIKGIIEECRYLQQLNVSDCCINDDDVQVMTSAIETNSTLVEINLSENMLSFRTVVGIAESVSWNPNSQLKKVLLYDTPCSVEEWTSIEITTHIEQMNPHLNLSIFEYSTGKESYDIQRNTDINAMMFYVQRYRKSASSSSSEDSD